MRETSALSLSELERLIHRRQRDLKKLEAKREKLQRKILKIDEQIAALGGSVNRSRARPRNEMSLDAAIAQVLQKAAKPLGVGEILERVEKLGYRSGSANFRGIVNQTLIKDKRFASVSRGVYTMK